MQPKKPNTYTVAMIETVLQKNQPDQLKTYPLPLNLKLVQSC